MAVVYRNLAATGAILVASLGVTLVQAQDYVDVEAERAAATTPAPNDPYAPRGTQTYPATSYGVGTAPAGTAVAPAGTAQRPVTGAPTAAAPVAGQNQNLGTLFIQVQQLQQEVMRLNGRLEEQANEIRTLREQSLERYVDLDKRLNSGAAGAAAAAGTAPTDALPPAATTPATGAPPVAAQPGEAEAYRAAYSLVQAQKFDQAVSAFRKFQQDYPGGKYAPNAYYWLGELYLVVQPPDLESSRQSFTMLLGQYPNDSKAPDALYKLGKVQFMKGNREKAKEYLDQVISRYGSTNSSAVKLARDFLAENY
jgi:tol-pal system protein YbgF